MLNTRARVSDVAGLVTFAFFVGCASGPDRTFGPSEWEVVLRVPANSITAVSTSPDGALFVATSRALYRGIPAEYVAISKIADDTVQAFRRLSSPSRRVVYILGGRFGGPVVRRWRDGAGVQALNMPALQSWMTCGNDCLMSGIPWNALWARADNEAFVVGDFGAVARVAGDIVTLEPNPLMERARTGLTNENQYSPRLGAVTGDGELLYAASWSALLRYQNGSWDTMPHPAVLPSQRTSGTCLVNALAAQANSLLLGGNIGFPSAELPCVLRSSDGDAVRLDKRLQGFGQPGIAGGALQPDGSALFYASSYGRGEVAEVIDGSVRTYRFPTLRWFGGAATLGPYLYAGGRQGDTAIVVRVRRQ